MILAHITSDRYDPDTGDGGAQATRRRLSITPRNGVGLLDATLSIIYLSPRARGSGAMGSAEIPATVFFALGVLQNMCESPGDLRHVATQLEELSVDDESSSSAGSGWAGPEIRSAAAACAANHRRGEAEPYVCTPAVCEPPGGYTPPAPPAPPPPRSAMSNQRPGRSSLALPTSAPRAVDDGVVGLLATLPTYKCCKRAAAKIDAKAADEHGEHGETTYAVAEQQLCTVCLEDLQEGEMLRVLPCGHAFHMACVDRWLISCAAHQRRANFSCPSCRHDLRALTMEAEEAAAGDDDSLAYTVQL